MKVSQSLAGQIEAYCTAYPDSPTIDYAYRKRLQRCLLTAIMFNITANPPLSLYIHLPWCVRKCPYCDFNSHASQGDIPEAAYVDALLADLEQDLPMVWGRIINTVFLAVAPQVCSHQRRSTACWVVSVHAWPCVPRPKLPWRPIPARWKAPISTATGQRSCLSVGVQSFQDDLLGKIGRIHDAHAARARSGARMAGFENINLDLMFGLPGQSLGRPRRTCRPPSSCNHRTSRGTNSPLSQTPGLPASTDTPG